MQDSSSIGSQLYNKDAVPEDTVSVGTLIRVYFSLPVRIAIRVRTADRDIEHAHSHRACRTRAHTRQMENHCIYCEPVEATHSLVGTAQRDATTAGPTDVSGSSGAGSALIAGVDIHPQPWVRIIVHYL